MNPNRPADARIHPDDFVRLVLQHQGRLIGFLSSLLPTRSEIDDILQDTTTLMWEKRDEFVPGTNFGAWACRIAYLKVQEFRRQQKRRHILFTDDLLELLAKDAAAMGGDFELQSRALHECLQCLSSDRRRLILKRFEPRATLKSVAAMIGLSEVTARNRVRAILRDLEACISAKLEWE